MLHGLSALFLAPPPIMLPCRPCFCNADMTRQHSEAQHSSQRYVRTRQLIHITRKLQNGVFYHIHLAQLNTSDGSPEDQAYHPD
ncbi:hypothetical protein DL93DRAFT_2084423 [Clavulina sp. PMI_390]|nr:hypothetical protein DL93DRAFT_2084423 [Clavulina sp. PMI_390]